MLGYYIEAEISTSKGRIDAVVTSLTTIFILEFKVDDSAESAIAQIREKQYFKPYLGKEKEVLLVGISLKNKEIAEL
ncbi:MAG: hypothetical protein HC836_50520 [Richelia sp. RM2_1_2]|nr:hypothetical protein [Richelia sp. RM2_1_2]